MKKIHWLFLVGSPILAIVFVGIKLYYSLVVWEYIGPNVEFNIRLGETFPSINKRLSDQKLIYSARLFHRYCQYKGVLEKFKVGTYTIRENSNLIDIFNIFINEKTQSLYFTIPEGKNLYEIARMLDNRSFTKYDEFIKAAFDKKLLNELKIEGSSVEGYLYPDSYAFSVNQKAETIIKTMVNQFNKKIKDINFNQGRMSKKEIIILASMIEKETGAKSERTIISGVFHNRLKINMRLQSDPTTIYGMYPNYKGNISKKDLLTPTPYNTYTIKALPIGPISNPGIDSIKAAINPANHDYLYFVSQNDGSHIFSKNYKDHNSAVSTFQKNAKNREGKSWRDNTDK